MPDSLATRTASMPDDVLRLKVLQYFIVRDGYVEFLSAVTPRTDAF